MLPLKETAIFKALADLRKYEDNPLPILQTYYGQAYKGNIPEGIIGYCLQKHYTNPLGMSDNLYYFFIYRHEFYYHWRELCNYLTGTKRFNEGFTLSKQIFDDMIELNQTDQCEFLVGNCYTLLRFKPKEVIRFVTENKTEHRHKDYGVLEVGIPTVLCYTKENFR